MIIFLIISFKFSGKIRKDAKFFMTNRGQKSKSGSLSEDPNLEQGRLYIWTEHSTLILLNLKPVEVSKP